MQLTCHRVNTVKELKKIPNNYGVEVDVRMNDNVCIILHHDPGKTGELFKEFLCVYNHSFLILNVKDSGINEAIIKLLKMYKINDFFFLDCSFPDIYNLTKMNVKDIALRYSEFESKETILNLSGKADWIWVDCFTKFPLDCDTFKLFKGKGFKICIVSPELQDQPENIEIYKNYMEENGIIPDMVCTKMKFIEKWK